MPFKKLKNIEPQKVGATAYLGVQSFMDNVKTWQNLNLRLYPVAAVPVGFGSVNGLPEQARLDKVGSSWDMVPPPVPMMDLPDNYTMSIRYPWPEAIWPGTASGFHFSAKTMYAIANQNGEFNPANPSPYHTPVNTITQSSIIVVVYRLKNGFANQTLAGDLPNRLSPFFYPGEELITADCGLIWAAGGGTQGDESSHPSTTHSHMFHSKVKVGRKMKQDDMIVAEIRSRGCYNTAMPRAPVVSSINLTGFYAN